MISGRLHSSRSQLHWRVLAAALFLAAVVCMLVWADRSSSEPSPTGAAPLRTAETAGAAPTVPGAAAAVVTASVPALPVTLSVPDIDLSTRLIRLGQQEDGTVEVPENAARAGWYELGPPPGSPGTSVILGHVDSLAGPAVFYRLHELQTGDRISVVLNDGTTASFRVHSVTTYLNEDFPAQKVYGGRGRSVLNLVTCGGDYDSSRGGYQANVVVNARRV